MKVILPDGRTVIVAIFERIDTEKCTLTYYLSLDIPTVLKGTFNISELKFVEL